MKKNCVAKSLAIAAHLMILMAAPGVTLTQSTARQVLQPSASSDPYAEAFAGLTYTDVQKEVISKIRQDITSRRAAVLKDDKLTQEQKDAMLTGYTRIEYGLIFKELTAEQKKQVSTRMHARRAADQAAQKTQAPSQ